MELVALSEDLIVATALGSSTVVRVVLDLDGDFELRFGLDIICVYGGGRREREREAHRREKEKKNKDVTVYMWIIAPSHR